MTNETKVTAIRIIDLTKFDQLELGGSLSPDVIKFESQQAEGGKFGELLTTAVILGTILGIRTLAAWLLKTRKHDRILQRVEIVNADGSRRIETIDIDLTSSTAPKSDVLKQLASLLDIDLKSLLDSESC